MNLRYLLNAKVDYIFALWFLSFYLLSIFLFCLAYSQRSEIGCLPYFRTWCGLSANLECMSEMCCTWLAENTGRKNSHFGTIAQLWRSVSSQLRHVSTKMEKNLLNIDISSTCPDNIVNFSLLTAEICWRVWGTPANFNGFHHRHHHHHHQYF